MAGEVARLWGLLLLAIPRWANSNTARTSSYDTILLVLYSSTPPKHQIRVSSDSPPTAPVQRLHGEVFQSLVEAQFHKAYCSPRSEAVVVAVWLITGSQKKAAHHAAPLHIRARLCPLNHLAAENTATKTSLTRVAVLLVAMATSATSGSISTRNRSRVQW